jgi:UDP-N-acetylglucosamine--N-acetylmuramyl-(pentapeptide) pyrophosphoryl-undecaprenol N-acetylglucosamine transferase
VFCGGGTGGHVYPALTVASALRRCAGDEPLELLYLGVRGKNDAALVAREGIPFQAVSAAPLRVGNPIGAGRGLAQLARGTLEAHRTLGRFRPDVVFATGGYGSAGAGLAARLRRVPLLLFLPDVEAGMAVRLLARLAARIAVTNQRAQAAFPVSKTVLTGYPVRTAFFEAERDDARRRLGLDPALPVVLVAGGSTGSRTLNRAVASGAAAMLGSAQIVHVSGYNDFDRLAGERDRLPPALRGRYHVHAYLQDEMPLAFAAADLGVMRAGASTLGELPAAHLPAVLVPGDFSDQRDNAVFLEEHGAAVLLPESRLAELPGLVSGLLADQDRLATMREALGGLARPDAAANLARLVVETAPFRREAVA